MTPSTAKLRAALALAAVLVAKFLVVGLLAAGLLSTGLLTAAVATDPAGIDARQASVERRSGVWLSSGGEVVRLLKDDLKGSRHQRFIIRLKGGQTLLISHNIDLAPRVPLATGDEVEVRGRYEWNAKGGLLHWTHHDPEGKRPGGWIRLEGNVYR
ncbi:MAG: DUF3465 domain-containing protein [Nitrospinaceae bacterium]|jgi:hypothetical protein|nr:DUF3465 domain-containing protein [Nitrospinaceae bacterium]MBT4095297.1 DUF3465 domain-containing protein [Nitrospinaceae bacterium]MBT4432069.1 DUF3465 domain-containing protein [Nitrospinaceae bacterium]MBT5367099.1 DUF3465 domain-containing protein [Nitrospinaceae bacterium]MBT5948747.1 DUF3465 domain-containing protein [Nitrospinaceae bacterium]